MRVRGVRMTQVLPECALSPAASVAVEPGLCTTVDLACQLLGAGDGVLVVLGAERQVAQLVTRAAVVTPGRRPDLASLGEAMVSRLLRGDASVRLSRFPGPEGPAPLLGLPVALDDRVLGALVLHRRPSDEEFGDDDVALGAALAAHAGVTLDHARLVQDARVRTRSLEASTEVSRILLEGHAVDEVLWLVARRARELVSASLATVALPDVVSGTLVVRVAEGEGAELVLGMALPEEGSTAGEVVRRGLPVTLPATPGQASGDPLVARAGGRGAALFVPLAMGDEVFGTLSVANLGPDAVFDDDDVAVVESFAADAAAALRYGRIRNDLGRLSILEERERIAMDLHDGVVQALFAVGLSLHAVEGVADDTAQVRSRISWAIDSIDGAIRDLRDYIFGLRPEDDDDRQLEVALRLMADSFGQCGRVSLSVDIDAEAASMLAPKGADVVHAAREAISNAVRHADSAVIDLCVAMERGHAVLEVTDHGRGFDVDAARGRGSGLANLRSRAAALGGTCHIRTSPGQGTRVRILVPV